MESKNKNKDIYDNLKINYNYYLRKNKDDSTKNSTDVLNEIIDCVENHCTDSQLNDFHNFYLKSKEEKETKATPFDVVVITAQKKRSDEKNKETSSRKEKSKSLFLQK